MSARGWKRVLWSVGLAAGAALVTLTAAGRGSGGAEISAFGPEASE
ncbi:hypothetical protein [Candidatus Poriferisodalis sp.]